MDDRELLERAAKAAGYDVAPHPNARCSHALLFVVNGKNWNPLADDGDALRLQVRLGFTVYSPERSSTGTWVVVANGPGFADIDVWEKVANDPLVATRRAIVRAAASLPL